VRRQVTRRLTRLRTLFNVLKYRKTWWKKRRNFNLPKLKYDRTGTGNCSNLIMRSTVYEMCGICDGCILPRRVCCLSINCIIFIENQLVLICRKHQCIMCIHVFQVTFSKLSQYEGVCWSGAYGSRQMLKIQMYFSDKGRDSWMFDIGDSVSNNGWGKAISISRNT